MEQSRDEHLIILKVRRLRSNLKADLRRKKEERGETESGNYRGS